MMIQSEARPLHGHCGRVVSQLIERLMTGTPGDKITDEELSGAAGVDVSRGSRKAGSVYTAVRFVAREHSIFWKRIRGAGALECLNNEGIANESEARVRHIRRSARRATVEARAVVVEKLPTARQNEFLAHSAVLAAIGVMSDSNTRKRLEVRGKCEAPTPQRLLEAFGVSAAK